MGKKEKTYQLRVEGLSNHDLWHVWTDVNNWHTWDTDIEWAKLEQPFQDGSTFLLKPKGGPAVKITLGDVIPLQSFTDLARFPLANMYSMHRIVTLPNGLELSHSVTVTGPLSGLWWHLVGRHVAEGLKEQMHRLVERARL